MQAAGGGPNPEDECAQASGKEAFAVSRDVINEETDLRILKLFVGIETAKNGRFWWGVRQYFDQPSRFQVFAHVKAGFVDDPAPGQRPIGQDITVIGIEPSANFQFSGAHIGLKRPVILW